MLTAVNNGKYPVFDVQARISDVQKINARTGPMTLDEALKDTRTVNVRSIPANAAAMHGLFPLGDGDHHDYNIFFSARSGLYNQQLRLRKVDGKWLQGLIITRVENNTNKEIFRQIPADFPNDVEWE